MITLCFIIFGKSNFNIEKLKINFDLKFKYLISYNGRDEVEYLNFIQSDFIKSNDNIHVYLGNKVYWAGLSIVDSMVNIINKAKEIFNTKYAFVIDGKAILLRSYDYILSKLESDKNINFYDYNQNWKRFDEIIDKVKQFNHYYKNLATILYVFRNHDLNNATGLKRIKKIVQLAKKNRKKYLKKLWKEKNYSEWLLIKKNYWKSLIKILSPSFIFANDNFWVSEYHGYDPKIFFGEETLTKYEEDMLTRALISFGLNISGNLEEMYNFVNSNIFIENYEKFKNISAPEEFIFTVAYAEYNKNWKKQKSYSYTLRNFRIYYRKKKDSEILQELFNESDPNYGYYFFYRPIMSKKELEHIKKFINKNENKLN